MPLGSQGQTARQLDAAELDNLIAVRRPKAALFSPETRIVLSKTRYAKRFVIETVCYIVFLAWFTFVTLSYRPSWAGEMSDAVVDTLVANFTKIDSASRFWVWCEKALLPTVYPQNDLAGRPLSHEKQGFMLDNNKVLGTMRFRQVRSPLNTRCNPHYDKFSELKRCYPSKFHRRREDRSPFGDTLQHRAIVRVVLNGTNLNETDSNSTATTTATAVGDTTNITEYEWAVVPNSRWRYYSGEELCNTSNPVLSKYCSALTVGRLRVVYPTGGFIQDFPPASYFEALEATRNGQPASVQQQPAVVGESGVAPTVGVRLPPSVVSNNSSVNTGSDSNLTNSDAHLEGDTDPSPPTEQELLPELPLTRLAYSQHQLKELQDYLWIDKQTAFIAIDMTTYNGNVRMLTSSRFMIEIYPTGVFVPKVSVKPILLMELISGRDYVLLVSEIVLGIMVLTYVVTHVYVFYMFVQRSSKRCMRCSVKEIEAQRISSVLVCPNCQRPFDIRDLRHCPDCHKDVESVHHCWKGYFQNWWHFLEVFNLGVFCFVLGARFALRYDLNRLTFQPDSEFVYFYPVAWRVQLASYFTALVMLLSFIKTLKYFGRIRALSHLVTTLRLASTDLLRFSVLMFIIFVGFAISYYLCFGSDLFYYRDFSTSSVSLIRSLMFQFEYREMYASNSVLAPFLFSSFMVFVSMIIVNLVISILASAYGQAQVSLRSAETYDFLNSSLKELSRQLKKSSRLRWCFPTQQRLESALKLVRKLLASPHLSKMQSDDINLFYKQISDNPDLMLVNHVIKAYRGVDMDEEWGQTEFELLKGAVAEYKKEISKNTFKKNIGLWEEALAVQKAVQEQQQVTNKKQLAAGLAFLARRKSGAGLLEKGKLKNMLFGVKQRRASVVNRISADLSQLQTISGHLDTAENVIKGLFLSLGLPEPDLSPLELKSQLKVGSKWAFAACLAKADNTEQHQDKEKVGSGSFFTTEPAKPVGKSKLFQALGLPKPPRVESFVLDGVPMVEHEPATRDAPMNGANHQIKSKVVLFESPPPPPTTTQTTTGKEPHHATAPTQGPQAHLHTTDVPLHSSVSTIGSSSLLEGPSRSVPTSLGITTKLPGQPPTTNAVDIATNIQIDAFKKKAKEPKSLIRSSSPSSKVNNVFAETTGSASYLDSIAKPDFKHWSAAEFTKLMSLKRDLDNFNAQSHLKHEKVTKIIAKAQSAQKAHLHAGVGLRASAATGSGTTVSQHHIRQPLVINALPSTDNGIRAYNKQAQHESSVFSANSVPVSLTNESLPAQMDTGSRKNSQNGMVVASSSADFPKPPPDCDNVV